MMTYTLVEINKGPTCKVRILNLFDTEVLLKQDAEKVKRIVSVVAAEEDVNQVENACRVRRLQKIESGSKKIPNTSKASEKDVPLHLKKTV
jgi:hypothetical protein